jgi:DNA-binding transcriptional regulator YiaG
VTLLEFREWQRKGKLREIREDCGISGNTIALALGMNHSAVYTWEERSVPVSSVSWERYMRVMRGLMNHLEVPES